ncbi:hypothetical protein F2Q68_00040755 [Brassica cretica]|uniref:X8 domain-containing protein n=1 Tax=Brassica cretica TaxID=69181 RepID=A0A8S9MSH2_BRACR|nr:hypothetical protein F2Q68_00040755 [Brassica cretica]
MRVFLGLLLLLALTTSSSAIYCLCKDGIGEKELQTAIDYACGSVADCNPIHDNGPCYQPNNIKSHCDWAVNSYFQKAAQVSGSCNFSGTATTNQNPPSNLVTGCIYPSSASTTSPTGTTLTNGTTPAFGPTGPGGFQGNGAIYCLCKDGIGEKELQLAIDYACGSLADCNPIHDNGPCYQPNNIKSHCDWAVNSYFQKAAQVSGSCNFSGTATTNQNPPSNLVTGCIYPSSASTTSPTGTTLTNGTTPAFGPTGPGGFQGNGASSLVISPVFTLCFSSLVFLWGSNVRLGFRHV